MNLHEYQGKEILAQYGVRIQRGYVAWIHAISKKEFLDLIRSRS